MTDIKKLKAELKKKTDKNPEKYYAVETLKNKGFQREKCSKCGKYFWTTTESRLCGDTGCSGGYTFIGDSPAKKKMDFIQVWKEFYSLFKKLGYTPVKRYPVVARWRDDVYWTNASIYDFQPHVVSGEVEPPANPLVVPQPCIRFNDIDNVGITGAHYTSFVMIGQHAFVSPKEFDINKYLSDMFEWLETGMKLPLHELKFHEDQWGGGGNLGVCMEFFARGLEIGNQVYINYEITPTGYKDLNLKILDMGMGQERPSWITHGTDTSYEVNFPSVAKFLYRKTGVKPREDVLRRFLPYSGLLNMDEVSDIDKVWERIAKKLGMDAEELKGVVLPLSALYSIGDHTRTLLFAITDSALPSNVGGCYNLRVLLRRALGFIDTYDWDLDLADLCKEHALYLKPQYPELMDNLDEVAQILEVERRKYESTKSKSIKLVQQMVKKGIPEKEMIELYDSHGIAPEFLQEEAIKVGKKLKIPEDFYAKVAARHPEVEAKGVEEKFDLKGVPDTEVLYCEDYKKLDFRAKILKVINGKNIVLDKTALFATSGGQDHDTGSLDNIKVLDVKKYGNVLVHVLEKPGLKTGQDVSGKVDKARRLALAKNHTGAHIIGGAARKVLGRHVWQAGSQIDLDKGRLDITHYDRLSEAEKARIERIANKVIEENRKITKTFMHRNQAEQKYGFILYQGGAVPGKNIRVVNIENWDAQACGGTHLDYTGEVEGLSLVKTEKIQDGVVRLVFVAGKELLGEREKNIEKVRELVLREVKEFSIPEPSMEDLSKAAGVFRVSLEQLPKTMHRFVAEVKDYEKKLNKKALSVKANSLEQLGKSIFGTWKKLKKEIETLESQKIEKRASELLAKSEKIGKISLIVDYVSDFGFGAKVGSTLIKENTNAVVVLSSRERTACFAGKSTKKHAKQTLNMLIPNAKISGNSSRAVADKPLSLNLRECSAKLRTQK